MSDRYDDISIRQTSTAGHATGEGLGDRTERAADKALQVTHDEPSTTGDVVGETVGGLSGAATGAALGSLGGPIGTIIGAVAGAATGWWSGRAISEAASAFDGTEDAYYRGQYATRGTSTTERVLNQSPGQTAAEVSHAVGGAADRVEAGVSRAADRTADAVSGRPSTGASDYDRVRPAYQLGHLAGMNPDYRGRRFEEVEPDLRRGYDAYASGTAEAPRYDDVRGHMSDAYARSTSRGTDAGAGMSAGAVDRATDSGLLDRAADKLDDLKDRVDGNPASRPGPDGTDRPI